MKTKTLLYAIFALICFSSSTLNAQWEPTAFTKSTWVLCQAQNGNLIAADDNYPNMGGIYVSQDDGDSWAKADALDYSYTSFLVKDESIYMGGVDCNVAISHDNGETWSNVDFRALLPGVTDNNVIYAIEYHNGRIYASVLSLGVVYSEDNGVTWSLTDQESLWEEGEPDNGGQWTYNLRSYNGSLYNIGAFGIWKYDETADLWTQVDDYWYGGSSVVVNDVLYISYNAGGVPHGIRYTTDFEEWGVMPIPAGSQTTIRTIEYYEGAFFIGHVHDAVYYTLDLGQTWIEYREDFPAFSPAPGLDLYGVPMNFVFDGETMYCGVFSGFDEVAGVFKTSVPANVLNVEEAPSVFKTVVYPNPAKDFVIFQLPADLVSSGSLTITDALGRIQYSKTIGNDAINSTTVSTENWASGLYFYNLETNQSKASGKFIVE